MESSFRALLAAGLEQEPPGLHSQQAKASSKGCNRSHHQPVAQQQTIVVVGDLIAIGNRGERQGNGYGQMVWVLV